MKTENLFVKRVSGTIIMLLKDKPSIISDLSKRGNMTYSRTMHILDYLISFNLVNVKKEGRVCICSLTDEGKTVLVAIEVLKDYNCESDI